MWTSNHMLMNRLLLELMRLGFVIHNLAITDKVNKNLKHFLTAYRTRRLRLLWASKQSRPTQPTQEFSMQACCHRAVYQDLKSHTRQAIELRFLSQTNLSIYAVLAYIDPLNEFPHCSESRWMHWPTTVFPLSWEEDDHNRSRDIWATAQPEI